jgi:hypothetical protein
MVGAQRVESRFYLQEEQPNFFRLFMSVNVSLLPPVAPYACARAAMYTGLLTDQGQVQRCALA